MFALDGRHLNRFFVLYGEKYGTSKANYARSAFLEWKSGARKYTKNSLLKFVEIVPRVVSREDRFVLLGVLLEQTRQISHHTLELIVGYKDSDTFRKLELLLEELSSRPNQHQLNDELLRTMTWLCDNDSVVAKEMILHMDAERSRRLSYAARIEVSRLRHLINSMDSKARGRHEINLPYGTIIVMVRMPNFLERLFS